MIGSMKRYNCIERRWCYNIYFGRGKMYAKDVRWEAEWKTGAKGGTNIDSWQIGSID